MRVLPQTGIATGVLFVLCALGCQAAVDSGDKPGSSATGGSSSGGTASAGGTPSTGGGVALPPGSEPASLLPARIRRLTVAEYQASVSDAGVIGAEAQDISAGFVPDSRQGGFTVNEAQRVDPVFARQLSEAATTLAASVRQHAAERARCMNPASDHDQCAEDFIRSFGEHAYRRPVADDEVTQLMTVFHAGFDGGSYEEGIELTVRAMLQSASFLYLTEIGDGAGDTVKLTPYELASSISYLAQGGPPSAELLAAATSGALDTPEGRAGLLTDTKVNLFKSPAAAARVGRVLGEWLGTDTIADIAKDSNKYPDFAGVKGDIAREPGEFLNALVSRDGNGSLHDLLAGDWTMANSRLATLYGASGASGEAFVRVSTPGRLGILNQSAFLSVFAHAHESAPVLRGVALMRRVACVDIGDPVNLATAVVPPAPDMSKTTRQRYAAHATPGCDVCHDRIDNFGFAFEGFDGMGKHRDTDNGLPVDSSVVVSGTDFDGSYPDSNALVSAMAQSSQVRECFARHVYRALAATSDPAARASEDDFVKYWDTTLTRSGDQVTDVYVIGTLGAFLSNPSFNYRRPQ